ncbi:MAG: hypothetical protein AABW99_04050 [archaeon]
MKKLNYSQEGNYLKRKFVITTMFLIDWIRKLLPKQEQEAKKGIAESSIYGFENEVEEIHSIWDYIKLSENSQAAHIAAVLGFEEWITMEEILRRIKEIFGMGYQNDRSLYPYIKTLVDVGLVETVNIGGKKKWRKKDVLIKLKGKKESEGQKEKNREKEKAVA